jgi:hypothetical protein
MTITIDLGHGHTLEPVVQPAIGEGVIGLIVGHNKPTGEHCHKSWIPLNKHGTTSGWDAMDEDPWTLTPSLACTICSDHGWITDNRWVPT